jgi:hypothetical protein
MYHYNDIRPQSQRLAIAGFLIASVTAVPRVNDRMNSQIACNLHRTVVRTVVDENYSIEVIGWKFIECPNKCLFGVVRREHDDNPLSVNHPLPFLLTRRSGMTAPAAQTIPAALRTADGKVIIRNSPGARTLPLRHLPAQGGFRLATLAAD